MLAKRIIAALDVRKGRVVKGIKFKEISDAGDPVEMGKQYEAEGIDELVFLDITASHENRETLMDLVEKVGRELHVPFTVGGGVRTVEDVKKLARKGADKVFINTAAVERPELIERASRVIGSANLVIAIDAKRESDRWRVYTHGGRESRNLGAVEWARRVESLGAGEILLTSMDRDGTKEGYDLALTTAITDSVDLPVIASGGAGKPEHFVDAFNSGSDACLAASIFHYGEYTVSEVKERVSGEGLNVRKIR
ncbi:MAG: imidazole glycerol phosphate synthase subunit HisF [Candidatus Acetothermia bacterium]